MQYILVSFILVTTLSFESWAATSVENFSHSFSERLPKNSVAKIVYLGSYALSKIAFSGQMDKLVRTLSGRLNSAAAPSSRASGSNTGSQKRKRVGSVISNSNASLGAPSGANMVPPSSTFREPRGNVLHCNTC